MRHQVGLLSSRLFAALRPLTVSDKRTLLEWANSVSSMAESAKLGTRLHLLTLLFEVSRRIMVESTKLVC